MNQLTEKQRIKIYQVALEYLKNTEDELAGFCRVLKDTLRKLYPKSFTGYACEDLFPEVWAYKPKKPYSHTYWFSPFKGEGRKKRIKILKKILKNHEQTR